jgi:hypothetical protein
VFALVRVKLSELYSSVLWDENLSSEFRDYFRSNAERLYLLMMKKARVRGKND